MYAAAGALFSWQRRHSIIRSKGARTLLCWASVALSLLAWQRTVEGIHKSWSAVGLALALAAGLASNYFAVLAFFPSLAAGECCEMSGFGRWSGELVDRNGSGGFDVLLYLPLINKAVATFSPYAWNKVRMGAIADSYLEMVEWILWPALAVLGTGIISWYRKKRSSRPRGRLSMKRLPPSC